MFSGIQIEQEKLAQFCTKWKIVELSLFGSILRPDFSPTSDIDVLVKFDSTAPWTLIEFVDMREELQTLFGRRVDLLTKASIEASRNQFRKVEVLGSARVIYAQTG